MVSREQRLVFGEVADTYDRVRPSYPGALIDDVLEYSRSGPGDPALEVGAGTGRATALFAARGLVITALEPSPDMAAVARRKLAAYPSVAIEEGLFEQWDGPGGFRLIFAAQAWHWVPLEARYEKAHDVLAEGGALATFWNRPVWDHEPEIRARLDEVYERLAPNLPTRGPGSTWTHSAHEVERMVGEIEDSGFFGDVSVRDYTQERPYSTQDYLDLLSTQSDHRMLPEDQRSPLFGAVASVIDDAGSEVTLGYETKLYLARRILA